VKVWTRCSSQQARLKSFFALKIQGWYFQMYENRDLGGSSASTRNLKITWRQRSSPPFRPVVLSPSHRWYSHHLIGGTLTISSVVLIGSVSISGCTHHPCLHLTWPWQLAAMIGGCSGMYHRYRLYQPDLVREPKTLPDRTAVQAQHAEMQNPAQVTWRCPSSILLLKEPIRYTILVCSADKCPKY
jgi:hypothetical protein